ncbi:MAG: type II toxin-antitoxin system PemK/MazF family toxin [Myxococcales bacterium]|nr:type II toxin-antitoxin system PemK/MazF family toxin [Myxococcales bacterium]
MAKRLKRGEIWLHEFRPPDKARPVLVLSRTDAIEALHTVMVAPIRSLVRGLPSEVLVGPDEGLKKVSAISLDHVHTVEQAHVRRFLGSVSAERMAEVCKALAVATGCGPSPSDRRQSPA